MNALPVMLTSTAVVFVIALFASPSLAADLCPPLDPPKREGDYDRRMTETTFSAKEFATALHYFEQVLPRIIAESATAEDLRRDESYSIGYHNSLIIIKGYVLRQEALGRLAARDLMVERNQRGRASKADLAAANAQFKAAKDRFCDFVKSGLFSD